MNFPQVKGKIEKDYPLKKLNTWRTGGQAQIVFWPEDIQELRQMVLWCREEGQPVLYLGRGSNVLLPDQGFQGIVIVTTHLTKISWEEKLLRVEAGYSLMRLAREAADKGLSGLEFACGIPGTIGAAIAINAGAYGQEIGSLIQEVTVLKAEGQIETLSCKDINFGYRTSSLLQLNCIVLECSLMLENYVPKDVIWHNIKSNMEKRKRTQPWEYPNAGSVFRNPSGDSAGRLIEAAGWKGRRLGGAQVSEKHANFIINKDEAKSEDILTLIQKIQEDIWVKYGIKLQTEIRVITS